MSRETREFKTSGGNVVELKSFITGGEARQLQTTVMETLKMKVDDGGKPVVDGFDPLITGKIQDQSIKLIVVSLNGKTEKVLENILDLPNAEFNEIVAEVDKIAQGLSEEKKTA